MLIRVFILCKGHNLHVACSLLRYTSNLNKIKIKEYYLSSWFHNFCNWLTFKFHSYWCFLLLLCLEHQGGNRIYPLPYCNIDYEVFRQLIHSWVWDFPKSLSKPFRGCTSREFWHINHKSYFGIFLKWRFQINCDCSLYDVDQNC